MDLVRQSAAAFLQLSNNKRVNVFVGCAFKKPRLQRGGADLLERVHQSCAFGRGQDAHALQRAGEGLRTAAIRIDQPLVKVERAGETLEDLRSPRLEPPAPQFHFARCAACARTRMGNPIRLMKPCASF